MWILCRVRVRTWRMFWWTEFVYKNISRKSYSGLGLFVRTDWLAPYSTFLEKLTCSHLVKKFPAFYGTRRFITAFTNAHHLSLSWASSIQSILPHPTSWRSILILFSYLRLGLPSCLFPSGFPTKTLYTALLFPIRATCLPPSHSSRFDHPQNIGWAVQIIKLLIM